ncbi:MAG: hypothetical protein SPE24_06965 [Erysipelotrichaceae bacterium]|nr:hypothetical protein [Erysipelotrichaceae bacterium]
MNKKRTVRYIFVLILLSIIFTPLHIHGDTITCDNCQNTIHYNPNNIVCEGQFITCDVCQKSTYVPGNKHDYHIQSETPATCQDEGTVVELCRYCQHRKQTNTPKINHTWNDIGTTQATCTAVGIKQEECSQCGQIRNSLIPELGHNFSETVIRNPTCTENGLTQKSCTRCNESSNITTNALGHNFTNWKTIKKVTCTEDGKDSRACTRCNKEENKTVKALNHDFSEWKIINEPTCIDDGKEIRTCSRCNKEENNSITALAHEMTNMELKKNPTCIDKGYKQALCKRCNKEVSEDIKPLDHNFSEFVVIKEPSLNQKGYKEKKCIRCKDILREEIPALTFKEFAKEHPATVALTSIAIIGVSTASIYFFLTKKVAKAGVKVVGKSLVARTSRQLLKELEIKTIDLIATENEYSKSLSETLKKMPMIKFNFDSIDNYQELIEEHDHDLIIFELSNTNIVVINEFEDVKVLVIGLKEIIDKHIDELNQLKKDKTIVNYTTYDKNIAATILLPLYKPELDIDNSLEGLSLVLSVFGLEWAANILDLLSSGKEIHDIVKEGDPDSVDKLTVLADACAIFGIDGEVFESIASYLEKIKQGKRKLDENLSDE